MKIEVTIKSEGQPTHTTTVNELFVMGKLPNGKMWMFAHGTDEEAIQMFTTLFENNGEYKDIVLGALMSAGTVKPISDTGEEIKLN